MPKTPAARDPLQESAREKTPPVLLTPGNSSLASNSQFSYNEAVVSAYFANAAYTHSTATGSFLSAMDWQPLMATRTSLEVENAYAFSARREAADGSVQFAIAFEGSNSPFDLVQYKDWTANLSKYGWTEYYMKVQPLLADVLQQAMLAKSAGKDVEILIAGHSLGAAAASIAYADLFVAPGINFWPEAGSPLTASQRVYASPRLAAWSPAEIRSLLQDTEAYVFGAPSFLIDPNKLDAWGWIKFALSLLTPSSVVDFFYNLGKNVTGIVDVNNARIPDLAGFADNVFQFVHRDSAVLFGLGMDPVAALGSRQAGTELPINVSDAIYQRYGNSVLSLHSMQYYAESIARALTDSELTRSGDPFGATGLQLPRYSNGTAASDFLVNVAEAAGAAGNDVLLAKVPGTYRFNGGPGDDSYVVAAFGVDVTVSGPANERTDNLYFALPGTLSVTTQGQASIYKLAGSDGQASTVKVEHQNGYDVDLVGIINTASASGWTMTMY